MYQALRSSCFLLEAYEPFSGKEKQMRMTGTLGFFIAALAVAALTFVAL